MFLLSRLFNFFLQPGLWIGLLLVAGTILLWTRWRRAGRWILTATVTFAMLVTLVPVGLMMIGILEDRFPIVKQLPGPIDGIIVLGGTVNQLTTRYRGQPALTGGAERLTEFVALARAHPEAKLVFTGGSALILHPDVKETEVARLFLAQMGLDIRRVIFEDQSRNTYENALYSFRLVAPKPQERWVLITSASHMPRSVGTFRKAGWNPIPYPVDYSTYGSAQWEIGLNMVTGLRWFATALRAWSGLLVYRLLDRTDALFPAPDKRAEP